MIKLKKHLLICDIQSLEKLQKAIFQNEITVTCVGLYNHGKSTLLNVLIKDFDFSTFKTADTRETTVNKTVVYNGIKYIDTPGLNAKKEDDRKVMETIQNSDIILFVHTITTGELNKKEIEFLKNIQKHWSSPQEFIDRTIFVLSRIDNIEDCKDIKKTSDKIKEQIEDIFHSTCLIIPVSAIDYRDGIIENEKELVKKSKIEKIENFINTLSKQSRKMILKTKKKRFTNKINELTAKLNKKIKNNKAAITKLKKEQKKVNEEFQKDIEKIEDTLKSMYQRLENI